MIRRFQKDDSVFMMVEALQKDGCVVVENVLDSLELHALNSEIAPYLDKAHPDSTNTFMGQHTKRFGRLIFRIPSTREMVLDKRVLSVIDFILLPYCVRYQIHFTGVMHVMPGQTPQRIHRDLSPFTNPSPPMVVASMWAASDFTKENGATVVVPGSHLWEEDREAKESETDVAEMKAGSVLLYLGNLMHGAGSNTSQIDRTGVSIQYIVGWLRQEENQYLAVPPETARELPEALQRILGYDLAIRHWGYVDQIHPLNFINGKEELGGLEDIGARGWADLKSIVAVVGEDSKKP